MAKLKATKNLTKDKVGDFGATFGVQERVTIKMFEGLKELRSERNKIKQGKIKITTEMVTQRTRKVSSWKCPGSYIC